MMLCLPAFYCYFTPLVLLEHARVRLTYLSWLACQTCGDDVWCLEKFYTFCLGIPHHIFYRFFPLRMFPSQHLGRYLHLLQTITNYISTFFRKVSSMCCKIISSKSSKSKLYISLLLFRPSCHALVNRQWVDEDVKLVYIIDHIIC